MKFSMRIGLFLLLSGSWLMAPALAQPNLKTPNCADPQESNERICCHSAIAEVCKQFGYSAPGVEQNTQASSIPPLSEIDTLEPFGVAIGSPLSELNARMNAMGLRQDDCRWTSYNAKDVSVTVTVSLVSPVDGSQIQSCAKDLPIHSIYVTFHEDREEVFAKLPMPAATAARWIERFGKPYHDCRKPFTTAGNANSVRCMFDNADPAIQRLRLDYRHDPIDRSARLKIGQEGKVHGSTVVGSGQASGPESAEAVLKRNMANPIKGAVTCSYIKAALQGGKDLELDGVTIIEKGRMLAAMPEACD